MRAVVVMLAGLAAFGSGCTNSCQVLCEHMAEYAGECGVEFSAADVESCQAAYADPGEDGATCREWGQPDVLERQWTCEDVTLFQSLFEEGG